MSSQLEAVVLERRKKDKDHVTLYPDLHMISEGHLYSPYLLSYLKEYTQNPVFSKNSLLFSFQHQFCGSGWFNTNKKHPRHTY